MYPPSLSLFPLCSNTPRTHPRYSLLRSRREDDRAQRTSRFYLYMRVTAFHPPYERGSFRDTLDRINRLTKTRSRGSPATGNDLLLNIRPHLRQKWSSPDGAAELSLPRGYGYRSGGSEDLLRPANAPLS